MKSKLYVLISWPKSQDLLEIPEITGAAIAINSDKPEIMVPIDILANYVEGEVINDEFIWNEPLPVKNRHDVEITILKTGCIIKCDNHDLILRAQICIQETFNAATFIDDRGWLHTDKFIVEEEWRKMFSDQFNIGALNLKFDTNA
jgi:hypothetical protein